MRRPIFNPHTACTALPLSLSPSHLPARTRFWEVPGLLPQSCPAWPPAWRPQLAQRRCGLSGSWSSCQLAGTKGEGGLIVFPGRKQGGEEQGCSFTMTPHPACPTAVPTAFPTLLSHPAPMPATPVTFFSPAVTPSPLLISANSADMPAPAAAAGWAPALCSAASFRQWQRSQTISESQSFNPLLLPSSSMHRSTKWLSARKVRRWIMLARWPSGHAPVLHMCHLTCACHCNSLHAPAAACCFSIRLPGPPAGIGGGGGGGPPAGFPAGAGAGAAAATGAAAGAGAAAVPGLNWESGMPEAFQDTVAGW